MPCMKRVYKNTKAAVHWTAARNKERPRPTNKPVVNRGFCPPWVYIGFRLFVLLERGSGDLSSILWRVRRRLVSPVNSSLGIQSCPTPLCHSAVRPAPARPWYRLDRFTLILCFRPSEKKSRTVSSVRGSTAGQPLISFLHRFTKDFVCSCFRRDVQDRCLRFAGGQEGVCLLAGSTRRRPFLPSPAPPRCPALRRPDPTGP